LIHPLDLDALGAKPGDVISVASRRGIVSLYARADDGTPRGAVFIPFCFYEAAANLLTNPRWIRSARFRSSSIVR
jgi:formate dehydrogenase major subunit